MTVTTKLFILSTAEYSSNYFETTGSLWFFSKDEAANFNADIANNNNNFKYFKYKAKLLWNTEANVANAILKNATIAASLKYLSNHNFLLKYLKDQFIGT